MRKLHYILLTFNVLNIVWAAEQEKPVMTLTKLSQLYPVPQEVYDYITTNEEAIFKLIDNDLPYKSPYGYIKPDATRFEGKEILDDAIQKTGTQIIKTPTKYFYIKKNPDSTLDRTKYAVLSMPIEGNVPEKLSFNEIKQLFAVLVRSQYKDVEKDNFIKTPNGDIYIIDTAKNSFSKRKGKELESKIASRLLHNFRHGELSDAARMFLENKLY